MKKDDQLEKLAEQLRARRRALDGPKPSDPQASLFGPPPAPPPPTDEELFADFHRRNPQVYRILVRLAREAIGKGAQKLGLRMLWERLRWEINFSTDTPNDTEPFKLNDHLIARYARLIMAEEPDLAGIFETRERRRDE